MRCIFTFSEVFRTNYPIYHNIEQPFFVKNVTLQFLWSLQASVILCSRGQRFNQSLSRSIVQEVAKNISEHSFRAAEGQKDNLFAGPALQSLVIMQRPFITNLPTARPTAAFSKLMGHSTLFQKFSSNSGYFGYQFYVLTLLAVVFNES